MTRYDDHRVLPEKLDNEAPVPIGPAMALTNPGWLPYAWAYAEDNCARGGTARQGF